MTENQHQAALFNITPVPKPRQTRADKWKQRPPVLRYRAFADQVRAEGVSVCSGDSVRFVMPMPKSWSENKRKKMNGQPHTQRPDVDNLCKALLDAVYAEDSHIWKITIEKVWGESGGIWI